MNILLSSVWNGKHFINTAWSDCMDVLLPKQEMPKNNNIYGKRQPFYSIYSIYPYLSYIYVFFHLDTVMNQCPC